MRERELIERHVAAYAAYFGVSPALVEEAGDVLVRFPVHREREYAAAIARVDELGSHPALRAYLQRLGFDWGSEGYFSTIPSLEAFAARRRREGAGDSGFEPAVFEVTSLAIDPAAWLSACARGFVPFAFGTTALYARLARRRLLAPPWRRRAERYFLWGLQHDMTRHALFTHRVPADVVRSTGDRIAAFLERRRPVITPAPLLRFYESDLVRCCQSVWRDLPSADGFEAAFRARSVTTRLETMLAERLRAAERPSVVWLFDDATSPATQPTRERT